MSGFVLRKHQESVFFNPIVFCLVSCFTALYQRFARSKKPLNRMIKAYCKHAFDPRQCLRDFLVGIKDVPYYKEIITAYGIDLSADDIYAELKKFPILSREEIIQNKARIINENFKGKTIIKGSSGTTATSLVFPCPIERDNKIAAVWWRSKFEYGIKRGMWMGWFGGKVIIPIEQNHGPYYKVDLISNTISFSAFHISPSTIKEYYDSLKRMRLKWIHGHAHNIVLLSSLISENHLGVIDSVKFITTGADSLFQWQRKIIQEAFPNAMIRQIYGLTEGVASIIEDFDGELKVQEDYAYVEFIPLDEANPNLCRIIGTGFNNPVFPMIRYDTGDLATVTYDEKGNRHIQQIDGRTVDSIKLPNGRRISSTSMTNFEYTELVKEVQYYQKDLFNIYVRIVRRPGYDDNEEKKVIDSIRLRLPQEVSIHIEYVDKIERTKTGKIRYIISEV